MADEKVSINHKLYVENTVDVIGVDSVAILQHDSMMNIIEHDTVLISPNIYIEHVGVIVRNCRNQTNIGHS